MSVFQFKRSRCCSKVHVVGVWVPAPSLVACNQRAGTLIHHPDFQVTPRDAIDIFLTLLFIFLGLNICFCLCLSPYIPIREALVSVYLTMAPAVPNPVTIDRAYFETILRR
jgi:hypothetical protein